MSLTIDSIPNELIDLSLSFCAPSDLLETTKVSQQFHALSEDPQLWGQFFKKSGPVAQSDNPKGKLIKIYATEIPAIKKTVEYLKDDSNFHKTPPTLSAGMHPLVVVDQFSQFTHVIGKTGTQYEKGMLVQAYFSIRG